MEDLKWLAITVALSAVAFLYVRLLGGVDGEQGS